MRKNSGRDNKKNKEQIVQSGRVDLKAGYRCTLKDEKTKLVIQARQKMRVFKVDDGIVKDAGIPGKNQVRKCDYLCKMDDLKRGHLIELKGQVIKETSHQLQNTPKIIKEKSNQGALLDGLLRMEAYIVTPHRQKIPDNIDIAKVRLCRLLDSYGTEKVENIFDLLKFVKVHTKLSKSEEKDGVIHCSAEYPLQL